MKNTVLLFVEGLLLMMSAGMSTVNAQSGGSIGGAQWSTGPTMNHSRIYPFISTLDNGKVIAFGGREFNFISSSYSDLYDPVSNTFTETAMTTPRDMGYVVKLADGRYFIIGGGHDLGVAPGYTETEIYDPVTNTFTASTPMITARMQTAAAQLSNGKILVAGAWYNTAGASNAELFDTSSHTWSSAGTLNQPRSYPLVLPADDGGAVVMGGWPTYGGAMYEMVEYYNAGTNSFSVLRNTPDPADSGWLIAADPLQHRPYHEFRRTNGKYLILGYRYTPQLEYGFLQYDPSTKAITHFATSSPLKDSLTDGGFFDWVLDKNGNFAYVLGVDSASDPQKISLVAINLANGNVFHPVDAYTSQASEYMMCSMSFMPYNGKILLEGISTASGDYFHATDKTLILTPDINSGISEPRIDNMEIICYPNPAKDQFSLSLQTGRPGKYALTLVDMMGRIMWASQKDETRTGNINWSFSDLNLAPGMYKLIVSGNDKFGEANLLIAK